LPPNTHATPTLSSSSLYFDPFTPPPPIHYFFFFNDTAPTEIYTLSLHDALPIYLVRLSGPGRRQLPIPNRPVGAAGPESQAVRRSEEHTSELQSRGHLVCRLLLEKKKKKKTRS